MGHICEESPLRLIRFLQFSLYPHFLRDIFVHNIRISLIPCHAVKNNTFNGMRLPDIVWERENGECEIVKSFGYEDFKCRL